LSHKAWKSVQRFDLGACPRKKWTGQDDRTVKKVTHALYFTYPTEPICTKICEVVTIPNV